MIKKTIKECKGFEKSVLACGTNPNMPGTSVKKWVPLHWCANTMQPSFVKVLLASGADPNLRNAHNRQRDSNAPIDPFACDPVKSQGMIAASPSRRLLKEISGLAQMSMFRTPMAELHFS
jgi:hypothetical protein